MTTDTHETKQYGEFHNPDVQVTNWREIAARGLTPNHLVKPAIVEIYGQCGPLKRYEHFDRITTVSILSQVTGALFTADVPHLHLLLVHD